MVIFWLQWDQSLVGPLCIASVTIMTKKIYTFVCMVHGGFVLPLWFYFPISATMLFFYFPKSFLSHLSSREFGRSFSSSPYSHSNSTQISFPSSLQWMKNTLRNGKFIFRLSSWNPSIGGLPHAPHECRFLSSISPVKVCFLCAAEMPTKLSLNLKRKS